MTNNTLPWEMDLFWERSEPKPKHVFSVTISDTDQLAKDYLFKVSINKDGKHSERIILTICIGDDEGNVPHMHIFRGDEHKPSQNWANSIRLQFRKSQYFEKLTVDELTKKEIALLSKRLAEPYSGTDHSLWEELIINWNKGRFIVPNKPESGWLPTNTNIPDYTSGIAKYK